MAQSPSLTDLLTASSDYAMSNIHTSIPGIIVGIKNMGQLCVDVQPTVNIRSQDGTDVSERPPILNVPFQQPISKQGGLTYPVVVGNPVWLNFSMRGLEVWKRSNGYPSTPSDMRTFDIRDCVATPQYPFGESPNQPEKRAWPHDPSDVVLVHNIGMGSEVEIRLKPNGDVIVNSPAKVVVNCEQAEVNASSSTEINTGDFTVTSDTVTFATGAFTVGTGTYAISASGGATMSASLKQSGSFELNGIKLETHRHTGVQSGPDTSGGPTG